MKRLCYKIESKEKTSTSLSMFRLYLRFTHFIRVKYYAFGVIYFSWSETNRFSYFSFRFVYLRFSFSFVLFLFSLFCFRFCFRFVFFFVTFLTVFFSFLFVVFFSSFFWRFSVYRYPLRRQESAGLHVWWHHSTLSYGISDYILVHEYSRILKSTRRLKA